MHISIPVLVFWICLAVPAYVYFGYPGLLASGLLARRKSIRKQAIEPTISVIVAAHNEEAAIAEKIDSLLACEYPAGRLEILVGSDGSADRTEEIARSYARQGVRLIAGAVRRGKSSIQNDTVAAATGEILVFTDADCVFAPEVLRGVVENFADPSTGLVTGTAFFVNSGETGVTRNENLYSRYEGWIRQQESDRGLLAAASGSLFAMRRELWTPLEHNVGDDFVLPLQVALQKKRNVLDPAAIAWTKLPVETSSMFKMKKRIVSKDLRGLLRNAAILNPFTNGAIAIGLWSHKLLRWLVAYFLCGMFLANLFLLHRPFYQLTFIAQILFYAAAFVSSSRKTHQVNFPWSVILSFCTVNCAAMFGVFDYVTNRSFAQWKPERQ